MGFLRVGHDPALSGSSQPILDWIAGNEITHLAVHFDLDVLDPAFFPSLLFNKRGIPENTFDGIVQGTMKLEQVVRLLNDVAAAAEMVGLAITEHLPWDVLRLKQALAELPILKS